MKKTYFTRSRHQNFSNTLTTSPTLRTLVFGMALAGCAAQGYAATAYTISDLGTVSSGAIVGITPTTINAGGLILGSGNNPLNAYPLSTLTSLLYDPANGTLTDIQAFTNGGWLSDSRDINASSQVAGTGHSAVGVPPHAFVRNVNGTGIDLGTLTGDYSSVAYAINDSGQVVGSSSTARSLLCETKAFLGNVNGSIMQPLGTLEGSWSQAYGINNHGQAVGTSAVGIPSCTVSNSHAYVSTPTGLQDLHSAGMIGTNSTAWKINDSGLAVGDFETGLYTAGIGSRFPNGYPIKHAVVWDTAKGTYTDLGSGNKDSSLRAINASGQMIGHEKIYSSANFVLAPAVVSQYPVVGDSTGLTDLNTLIVGNTTGLKMVSVNDINDAGQIIGIAQDANGAQHSVLLTPATAPLPTPPIDPSNLASATISSTQINLAWTDNNSTNEISQDLERCQNAGCTNFAPLATLPAGTTSYNETGLKSATSYSYRVRSHGANGDSGYSNISTAMTASAVISNTPAAPGNLTSVAISRNKIVMNWADNANNEQNYQIERCKGLNCTNFSKVAKLGTNVKTYTDSGLNSKTYYSYRVQAINRSGKSNYSNIISVKTL